MMHGMQSSTTTLHYSRLHYESIRACFIPNFENFWTISCSVAVPSKWSQTSFSLTCRSIFVMSSNISHSNYDFFSKNESAEMMDVYGDNLKHGARAHKFCSSVQHSSWVKAVFLQMIASHSRTPKTKTRYEMRVVCPREANPGLEERPAHFQL